MTLPPHSLLLVLPCLNETGRIGAFLPELCERLEPLGDIEILVVDDGSPPEEQARMQMLVEGWREKHPCLRPPLLLATNVGKGGAVYAGWGQAAEQDWLGFVDADGSVPAHEVARLIRIARMEEGPPRAWCASRVRMLGRKVERSWYREFISHVFHWVVDLLLALPAHDTQCGCKLVPRAAFERARPGLSLKGFAFDLDLILGLRHTGCEVSEVPVDWHEVPGGKLRLLRDSWRMLRDVVALRERAVQPEQTFRVN